MRAAARNGLALACAAALCAPAAAEAVAIPNAPFADSDYWEVADRVALRMDRYWVPGRGYYKPSKTRVNAPLLVAHAIAAIAGHQGPTRNDVRARRLVERFLLTPPWNSDGSIGVRDKMFHIPGWTSELDRRNGVMGKVVDPEVAEGLLWAWRARRQLALPQATLDLLKDRVDRASRARFYRYPNTRLNQWNFNAVMYAARAEIVGDASLLRLDYRRHLKRFVNEARRPRRKGQAGNLSPSYRFQYFPAGTPIERRNLDSAEYANIVIDGLGHYDEALAAGMTPLPQADLQLLRAWVERALGGYWTHGGYLNWDTGHGFDRWHFGNFWAFADNALVAIATTPEFQISPERGAWAKWIFDRSLRFYTALLERQRKGLPSSNLFGIKRQGVKGTHSRIFAARMMEHAARGAALGLSGIEAVEPPPLYGFDADVGRLAVTTPRYSTAIVPVNARAFPYGGVELARLFDGDQHVVSGTGGRDEAAFGVVVRDDRSGVALRSQTPREHAGPKPPLVLTRSPRGAIRALRRYPEKPDAGPFDVLEAVGAARGGGYRVLSRHRFLPSRIESSWEAVRLGGSQQWSADAQFPLWGKQGRVAAVLKDGSELGLAGPGAGKSSVAMASVAYFLLRGSQSSYVVVPGAGGLRARTFQPRRQAANPNPGPTLAISFARRSSAGRATFSAVLIPGATKVETAKLVRRLGRRARR